MGSRLALITSIVAFCLSASGLRAECAQDRVVVDGQFGTVAFTVDVADDDSERSQGLMHVASMPRQQGMLFVFDPPRPVAFWMRNTLIPLDMIFTDTEGEITHIHENAIPHDETPIPGVGDVFTVLEINGGLVDRYGIKTGDRLRHPAYSTGDKASHCKNR